jgi:hypothetical protein
MNKIVLTEAQAQTLGDQVVKLLRLRRERTTKRFATTWGTFTTLGLGNVILRLVNEVTKDMHFRVTLVPRWEHWQDGKQASLFFWDEDGVLTRYGWRDQHADASLGFYRNQTSAADHDDPKVQSLIAHYMQLPGNDHTEFVIGSRLARAVDLHTRTSR